MNLQIFIQDKVYISILAFLFFTIDASAWEIDLSRRTKDFERSPASIERSRMENTRSSQESRLEIPAPRALKKMFPATASHEVVILNTEKGFVPSKIQLKKGQRYTIHVVNVNQEHKNSSFILDSFAKHFGTFFGKTRSFVLEPKKEGIYSYISPEVAAQGKIVVVSDQPELRVPASTDD